MQYTHTCMISQYVRTYVLNAIVFVSVQLMHLVSPSFVGGEKVPRIQLMLSASKFFQV